MLSTHWNSDHPVDAPAHAVKVWIAYQHTSSQTENCDVCFGFWDSMFRCWRFESGVAVRVSGHHVCGWLPIEPPTYEVAL